MTETYAAVEGVRATKVKLTVSNVGPWVLDAVLEDATAMSGRVTATIGELTLSGTIDPKGGTFGEQRTTRIVGGAGAWGKALPPRGYHNDAGVKALNVAQDAAREAGETLGTFTPRKERLGLDYTRLAGAAGVTLANAAGGAPWWVDYEGTTHVGPRPALAPAADSYEVLEHDTRAQVVTLSVDDPGAIGIGSILTERLDVPQVVREFELVVSPEKMRIKAWCGGGESTHGQLTEVIKRIVRRVMNERAPGVWIYRVVQMAGDRVHLQIVSKETGLPDVLHVSMWPGVAGAHAALQPGSEVGVQFANGGDLSKPIITHFAGKDGKGHVPDELNLCNGEKEAARNGDSVEMLMPPLIFTGTVGGAPATGVLTAATGKLIGSIIAGSGRVKIG